MTDIVNIIETVSVPLGERAYDILIGTGLIDNLGGLIKPVLRGSHVVIVTDENVASHYGDRAKAAIAEAGIKVDMITVPAGEATKSFAQYEKLLNELLALEVERSGALIALGGGVIGDLTGYAAATLRRGIDFIQVPTSLLAQVDSSVGGKTGINTKYGKNLVGAFYQPRMVIADLETLDSLERRELHAGYGEVVKYGLINKPDFFNWLEENSSKLLAGDRKCQAEAVATSCREKARVVVADEHEAGIRALLNLGHTFGHALEAECGYDGTLLHGEGVAIGMVLAFEVSAAMELLSTEVIERIRTHLKSVGLPVNISDIDRPFDTQKLLAHMAQDKKVSAGIITFILARGIGKTFATNEVSLDIVAKVLETSLRNS